MKTTGAKFTLSLETTKTTSYIKKKKGFLGTGQQATKNSYGENEISLGISKANCFGSFQAVAYVQRGRTQARLEGILS